MTPSEYAIRYLLYQFPELRKKKVREGLSAFVYGEERKRLATWQVEDDVARPEARDRADAAARYLRDIASAIEAANQDEENDAPEFQPCDLTLPEAGPPWCGEPSPEAGVPCSRPADHPGPHVAQRGPFAKSSWASGRPTPIPTDSSGPVTNDPAQDL